MRLVGREVLESLPASVCIDCYKCHTQLFKSCNPFHRFANLRSFLILFCIYFFIETTTVSYLASSIQSIERYSSLPSRLSGPLVGAMGVGYSASVIVLAHFGSKGHRSRWIGAGCLLTGVACLVMALPMALFSPESLDDAEVGTCIYKRTAEHIGPFRRM